MIKNAKNGLSEFYCLFVATMISIVVGKSIFNRMKDNKQMKDNRHDTIKNEKYYELSYYFLLNFIENF